MKELYKVREIIISLLDQTTHKPFIDIPSEFGVIIEKEGLLFIETHMFNDDYSAKIFNFNNVGYPASIKMSSFDGIVIEAPYMLLTGWTTKEHKLTFRCLDFIKVYEEDVYYAYKKLEDKEIYPSQLLRIDLWGLDLLITSNLSTSLIVSDAPFEMKICSDEGNGVTYIHFPTQKEVAHNTLTEELFEAFRFSLVGYLSLINGARIQITKEYYNGYSRIYSYERIENLSRSYYTCGNAKCVRLSPILFEFDNYVRWNRVLNLNKFVHHICTAQQVAICEDSSFILILAFEGLCKKYLEVQSEEKNPKSIISKKTFMEIRKELLEVMKNHVEISYSASKKFNNKINNLNSTDLATKKFNIFLNDLNIEQTEKIVDLTKRVRSTLVHEAELKEYTDYQLLSELIREAILRLICSNIERHSYFKEKIILGDAPYLSFHNFINENKLTVKDVPIFDEHDSRIKLRIKNINNKVR